MNCPYCGGESKVKDSRSPDGVVRRRRECGKCSRRFTTLEQLVPVEIRVTKRHGRPVEQFDGGKILRVLERLGDDCALSADDRRYVARKIETDLVDGGHTSIDSGTIAERLLAELRSLDRLAADRFAADYTGVDGVVRIPRDQGEDDGSPTAPLEQLGLFGGA